MHDYLLVLRGAERTFASIADCWPSAPIYTLLFDERGTRGRFAGRTVHTSSLQRLRLRQDGFRHLLPLFPRATERLPVEDHELVISSSSAFAHGVRPRLGATHISYCHTPFRYAWHEYERTLARTWRPARPLAREVLRRIRAWDLAASARVTHYIANSEITKQRIADTYGRDATVVPPPVEVARFTTGTPEDYFLIVSEIVWHKRVDLALEAARRAGQPVRVVGGGPDLKRLEERYGSSATFLGRVSDPELERLYAGARALIVPNVEEFGIAGVEAQAAGRPVVAADAGGARETIVDGETGVLVPPGDVDALAEALRETDFDRFRSERIRANAERFSAEAFKGRLLDEVRRLTDDRSPSPAAIP